MAGKFLIRAGEWLNARFPEKVSAEAVQAEIASVRSLAAVARDTAELQGAALAEFAARVSALEKKVETLATENIALKASAGLRSRVVSSIPVPGR